MTIQVVSAQGWYTDPFGRHQARWFSGGFPTGLVRDGQVESRDPDLADHLVQEPTPIYGEARADDMLRADAQDAAVFDRQRVNQAVFTTMVQIGN